MLAVSFRHDSRQILLPVAILHSAATTDFHRTTALLDTGASVSGVSRAIADTLGLIRRGKTSINTPRGQEVVGRRLMRIGLFPNRHDTGLCSLPHVIDDMFLGIECSPGSCFDVLIGMDLISRGELRVNRDGSGSLRL